MAKSVADDDAPEVEPEAEDDPVRRGFLHLHTQLSRLFAATWELAASTTALADLLVQKGLVRPQEMQGALRRAKESLLTTDLAVGLGVGIHDDTRDKYDHPETVAVDCDARLSLCRAACCTLDVPLAGQDVTEGKLRWDLARPYFLTRRRDGYCSHLGQDHRCGVFHARPLSCRTYTCQGDPRIWQDFEGRVPNVAGIEALFAARRDERMQRAPTPNEGA